MPPPHPLTSLHAGGEEGAALASSKLAAHLAAHGGNVRAAAAALVPPIHETTLHDWLTGWGLRKKTEGEEKDA